MSNHELPPLPDAIMKDMQSLRNTEPSAALIDRAMSRLPEGASVQTTRKEEVSKRKSDSRRHSWMIFAVPVAAMVAGAALFMSGTFDSTHHTQLVHVEERTLALPETGHAWTSLDLKTHHHADEPAVVHLEVPTNVRVRLPAANGTVGDERHCLEKRCVHRFTQHHGSGVPVRIAVTHPGRYDIHVRHESKFAAMREHYVLVANRDK